MKEKFLILCLLPVLFTMCRPPKDDENHHYLLPFENKTDRPIYVFCELTDVNGKTVSEAVYYPDPYKTMGGNTNDRALFNRITWEDMLAYYYFDGSDIVYVLDGDKLEAEPDSVDNALLAKYYLTLPDLRAAEWRLSYPPSEKMKSMKMWPPFTEFITGE